MKPLKSYFLSQRDILIALSNSKPCEIEPKRLRIELRERERENYLRYALMMRLRDLTSRASSSFLRRRRSSSSSSRRMTLSFNFIGSNILAGTWVFLLCGMTDETSTTQLTLAQTFRPSQNTYIYIGPSPTLSAPYWAPLLDL